MEQINIELVTPERAREYLALSGGNRAINRKAVTKLKTIISDNEWHFQISPIMFNQDGTLIDGHHRLTAVAETGTPVQMLVMRNVPKTAQRYIDTGRPRAYADTLHYRGVKNSRYVEACLRIIVEIIEGGRSVAVNDLDKLYNLFAPLTTRSGKCIAYMQFPLTVAEMVFRVPAEIIQEVNTGYNIKKGSLSDKITRIYKTPRTDDSGYRMNIVWDVLEVSYRFSKGMPFRIAKLGDEKIRNEIRNALIDWATNPLADRG